MRGALLVPSAWFLNPLTAIKYIYIYVRDYNGLEAGWSYPGYIRVGCAVLAIDRAGGVAAWPPCEPRRGIYCF